jgi:hypothetical protein
VLLGEEQGDGDDDDRALIILGEMVRVPSVECKAA